MFPYVRNAVSIGFMSLLMARSQECWDADCELNVQLLQQDVNLKATDPDTSLEFRPDELPPDYEDLLPPNYEENGGADVNLTALAQQATSAFIQFNEMISEGRAEGEVRLADRMGGSLKLAAKNGRAQGRYHPELLSYADRTNCGPMGYHYNFEWCGWYRQKFHVRKTFKCIDQVFTSFCESGIAKLVNVQGDGTEHATLLIDDCEYNYYAQYQCLDVIVADLTVEDNFTYLKELEKNLTDMLHSQALVISKTTDKYLAAQAVEAAADATTDDLEDKSDYADAKEATTANTHGALSYALWQKKQELDALQNATDEANETLQIVKPKYLAADAAYQAALGPAGKIEDYQEDAQQQAEEAQAALDAADQAKAAADLAVDNQTMRLQKEVAKLNDRNDELRKVHKKLDRPLPPK